MHGYEIIQELNYRDAKDWVEISKPQIYYSLEKLHRNKFIALASDQEAPSGPDRQTFKITTLGKTSLNERLKSVTWTNQRPPTPF
jgi:DNA-binding PadR family transcriptional regulator